MREQTSFVPLGAAAAPTLSPPAVTFRLSALASPDAPDANLAARVSARAAGFAAGFAVGAREAAATAEAEATRVAAERAATDAEAAAAVAHALDVLAGAARAAEGRTVPVLAEAEALLHAYALQLARAVLGVELDDAERSATAALGRVLRQPRVPESVTVHLHPRDLDALRVAGADEVPDGVVLVADPALTPGDAVATHVDGFLDARIGAALDRAAAALTASTVDLA